MKLTKKIALVSTSLALFAAPTVELTTNVLTTQAASQVSQVKVTKTDYFYNSKGKKTTYTYAGWSSKKVYKNTTYNVIKTVTINGTKYYYVGNGGYIKASVCKVTKRTNSKNSSNKSSSSSKSSSNSKSSSSSKTGTTKNYVVLANNAYEYNSKGKRANTNVLLKGHKYRYYSTKKIGGKLYYSVNSKKTLFVRDSDVRMLNVVTD